jgi:hypothetical protein
MAQEVFRSTLFGRTIWIRQDKDRSYQVSMESDRMVNLCRDFWTVEEAQTAAHEFAHFYLGRMCDCVAAPVWEAVSPELDQGALELEHYRASTY